MIYHYIPIIGLWNIWPVDIFKTKGAHQNIVFLCHSFYMIYMALNIEEIAKNISFTINAIIHFI